MGDLETSSSTDHKTGGVDLDVDGTLSNMEYLFFHYERICQMTFEGKNA